MIPARRRRRSVPVPLSHLAAAVACLSGSARATVQPDQGDPPAPTVVVMQQGDVATLGPGAQARPGDFRLEYGTVAFVVSQPGGPGRAQPGGALVDVVQLFPSARRLGLQELSQQGVVYVRATVSRSRDLGTVQLEGYDSRDPQIEVRTQYQLGPVLQKSDTLRIVTTVKNAGARTVQRQLLADTLRWGSLLRFLPGAGLAPSPGSRPVAFLEGLGPAGTVFYLPGGGALGALGGGEALSSHGPGWSEAGPKPADLAVGKAVSYSRLVQVTGDASRVLCQGPAGKLPVRGTVREDAGVPGALVVLERQSGEAIAATYSQEGGRFSLCAPSPGAYKLRAEGAGRSATPVPVQVGQGGKPGAPEAALQLSRPAHLHVSLREVAAGRGGARPAAARLSVTPLDGQPPRAVSAGSLPSFAEGNLLRVATAGEADLILPPGRYRVAASRGPFYELASQELSLRAGEGRKLALQLRRGVPASDTLGVRCAALRLTSAGDGAEAAQSAARAEGLDLLLSADTAAAEGREPAVVAAAEVSSDKGHLLAYPLKAGTLVPELRQVQSGAGLAEALRRLPGEAAEEALIQSERPGEDPPGAVAAADVVRIWSGAAPDAAALRAWLGALENGKGEGRAVTAVAAAEGRGDLLTMGAPRTCFSEAQSARQLSPASHLRAALRRGDAVLTNGPWLQVSANGAQPGEVASSPDGAVAVSVSVLASSYVDVRELEIWVGARRAAVVPVPPTGTPLRYRGTVRVSAERDAAIVVMARGNRPLDPVVPGATPLAISNPVYVDRDGDGRFGKAGAARPSSNKK